MILLSSRISFRYGFFYNLIDEIVGNLCCRMEMKPGKFFIGGISWYTIEDCLRDYFQSFGDDVEAVIMKDQTTGRACGFEFIVFANRVIAERAVIEKHVINARIVSFVASKLYFHPSFYI